MQQYRFQSNHPSFQYLSEYEKKEIWSYMPFGIYYFGSPTSKTYDDPPVFEDREGFYIIVPHDQIKYRYETITILGRGSYGIVVKCYDHKKKIMVAIKISEISANNDLANEYRYLVNLNRHFPEKKHCILQVIDSFVFRKHFCLVEELLSHDLQRELTFYKSGFAYHRVQAMLQSAFQGLACIHEIGIIHADIKTSNMALTSRNSGNIKILDFSCSEPFHKFRFGRYMGTRYYRAPEVILRLKYGFEIDIWSMGCVAAEMILGHPLFRGRTEGDQLAAIMEVIGLPPLEMIAASPVSNKYFEMNRTARYSRENSFRGPPGSKPLNMIFKGITNPELIDLIEKCLRWRPTDRLSSKEALTHNFIFSGTVKKLGVLLFIAAIFIVVIGIYLEIIL